MGHQVSERGRMWRSRWASIGAAVAVTFGASGLWVASASMSSAKSAVVTVDPARILDTRADVGLSGPFVSQVSQKLQVSGSITTSTGTKTVVPSGATGVLLNVTALRASANGFVSVRPGDATGAPSTSSLNFLAGQTVPNAVQVGLPTSGANAGQIDITYDALGVQGPTTELLVDVVGYLVEGADVDPELLARVDALETKTASNTSAIATNTAGIVALDAGQPFAVTARGTGGTVTATDGPMVSVTVTAPVTGQVTVNSSANAFETTPGDDVACSITTGTARDNDHLQRWESPGEVGDRAQLAGTRTFDIAAGATVTYHLVCVHFGSLGTALFNPVLTAIFTPAP